MSSPAGDVAAAAELLQLAMKAWQCNPELEQSSWASLISHVDLEGAQAGVDVDGHLVLVVSHRCGPDLAPVLEHELAAVAGDLGVVLRSVAAATPLPKPPTADGASLAEILAREAIAIEDDPDRRVRARGSFTLEVPVHEDLAAYADLVDALEGAMWQISSTLGDAQEGQR